MLRLVFVVLLTLPLDEVLALIFCVLYLQHLAKDAWLKAASPYLDRSGRSYVSYLPEFHAGEQQDLQLAMFLQG